MCIGLETFNDKQLDGLEFCQKVYLLFDAIRAEQGGINRLRTRPSPLEKRLQDELLPICSYVQAHYRLGIRISVCWRNGSQSYDAELRQDGYLVERRLYPQVAYLEVTNAMHQHEYLRWHLLADRNTKAVFAPEGISGKQGSTKSEPFVFRGQGHISRFVPIVISRIEEKAAKEYPPNTSLVVQCHLNSLYTAEDWRCLISQVEAALPPLPFREVLLFDRVKEQITPIIFSGHV